MTFCPYMGRKSWIPTGSAVRFVFMYLAQYPRLTFCGLIYVRTLIYNLLFNYGSRQCYLLEQCYAGTVLSTRSKKKGIRKFLWDTPFNIYLCIYSGEGGGFTGLSKNPEFAAAIQKSFANQVSSVKQVSSANQNQVSCAHWLRVQPIKIRMGEQSWFFGWMSFKQHAKYSIGGSLVGWSVRLVGHSVGWSVVQLVSRSDVH